MKKFKNFYSLAIIFCVFIFAAILIIVVNLMGVENTINASIEKPINLNESWVIITNEGEEPWEKLPYYNEYRADVFAIYNYLPDDLSENSHMFIRTNFQSVRIEIEGIGVVYDEMEKDTSVFGGRINVLSHFIKLDESYSGKKITIISENVTTFHYPTVEEVLIGDQGILLLHILFNAGFDIYFIGFISFLGVLLIVLSIILIINKSTKYIVDCLSLSVFTIILCTWLLSNVSSIHFIVNNTVVLFLIYLFMLYAVLLPIFILLRNKCPRFTKLFDGLFIGMIALMVLNSLLAMLTDYEFTDSLISLHIAIIICLLLMISVISIEYYKYENKEVKSLLVSGYIFITSIVLTVIAYYVPNIRLNLFNYDFYIKVALVIFVMINSVSYVQQVIIANMKISESAIYRKLAFTDLMTNLKNRSAYDHFINSLTEEIFEYISIIEVDIDWLKNTNDNYGHSVGDELIKKVSEIINEIFGQYGECFRIGGDEFEIIILNHEKTVIDELINKFQLQINETRSSNGKKIFVSIGYTFDDGQLTNYDSITNLINITDRLMYENKHLNKINNNYEE